MICEPAVAFDLEDNNQTLKKNIESDVEKGWKAMLSLFFKNRGIKPSSKTANRRDHWRFNARCTLKVKPVIPICSIPLVAWLAETLCKLVLGWKKVPTL